MTSSPADTRIGHYENFPVASVLCPAPLRAPIAAIYHFARTADDIADEGDASAEQRLADLASYRQQLVCAATPGNPATPDPRWAGVFAALAKAIASHGLPVPLLHDLLDRRQLRCLKVRRDTYDGCWSVVVAVVLNVVAAMEVMRALLRDHVIPVALTEMPTMVMHRIQVTVMRHEIRVA
jgi:hypothetical protein